MAIGTCSLQGVDPSRRRPGVHSEDIHGHAAFAQDMSLLMEGAYVTRQVTRNPETAGIARRMINMLVEKHVPAAR